MTLISEVFANANTDEVIIPTLEIQLPGETIRLCADFEDHTFGIEGGLMVLFEFCSLSISLPAKNSTGTQSLKFGFPALDGRPQRAVDVALESDQEVMLIYREYLISDPSAPARAPEIMVMRGGSFENGEAAFEAGSYDILNTEWPRERYTSETAPGIRFIA